MIPAGTDRRSGGPPVPGSEWLEADGTGGFASGHRGPRADAPLSRAAPRGGGASLRALRPRQRLRGLGGDAGRPLPDLLAGLCARTSSIPDGASRIESFEADPWPTWTFRRRRRRARLSRKSSPRAGQAPRRSSGGSPEGESGRVALGAPALFRARLPRAPPREPGLPFPAAEAGLRLAVDSLRRRARPSTWRRTGRTRTSRSGTATSSIRRKRRAASTATEDLASPGVFRFDLSKERGGDPPLDRAARG